MSWKLPDRGQGEGQARLVETDGHHAVVEATLPFAAGATLVAVDAIALAMLGNLGTMTMGRADMAC